MYTFENKKGFKFVSTFSMSSSKDFLDIQQLISSVQLLICEWRLDHQRKMMGITTQTETLSHC